MWKNVKKLFQPKPRAIEVHTYSFPNIGVYMMIFDSNYQVNTVRFLGPQCEKNGLKWLSRRYTITKYTVFMQLNKHGLNENIFFK